MENNNIQTSCASYNKKRIAYVIQNDVLLNNISPQEYLSVYFEKINNNYRFIVNYKDLKKITQILL